jgi:hypothetical protein
MKSTYLFILLSFVMRAACAQVTQPSATAEQLSSANTLEQRVERMEHDFLVQEMRLSAFEKQHTKGRGLIYGGIAASILGGIILTQGDTDMLAPASFMTIGGSLLTTFGGITVLQAPKRLRKEI